MAQTILSYLPVVGAPDQQPASPKNPSSPDLETAPTIQMETVSPESFPEAFAAAQAEQAKATAILPAPVPAPPPRKKGLSETGWFKRGELEAEAAARAAQQSEEDPLAGPVQFEVTVDEGSLTAQDRARLSLKTGQTHMMKPIRAIALPGAGMSDQDLLAEMDSSRKWMIVAGASIGMLALVAAIYFLFLRAPLA